MKRAKNNYPLIFNTVIYPFEKPSSLNSLLDAIALVQYVPVLCDVCRNVGRDNLMYSVVNINCAIKYNIYMCVF